MVELVTDSIDAGILARRVSDPAAGAVNVFLGVVRNNTQGKSVRYLEYEAYESMAVKKMEAIEEEVRRHWEICDFLIQHRTGRLEIGEASVGIAVSSPHRGTAFEATRFAIDTLKKDVPIWKKEYFEDGAVWVEGDAGGNRVMPENINEESASS